MSVAERDFAQKPGLSWCRDFGFLGAVILVLVHVTLVLAVKFSAVPGTAESIYEIGGLSYVGLQEGLWWQVVSHLFIHGDFFHLAVNAILFFYASRKLGSFLVWRRIFLLFMVAGVVAGLGQITVQGFFLGLHARTEVLVGASGGVFGMLLAYYAISPQSRMLLLPVSAQNMTKGFLVSSALLAVCDPRLNLVFLSDLGGWLMVHVSPDIFRVAHVAHLVGGLAGFFLVGRLLPRLLTKADLEELRRQREADFEEASVVVDGAGGR